MKNTVIAKGTVLHEVRYLPTLQRMFADFLGLFSNKLKTDFVKRYGLLKWSDTTTNLITSAGKAAMAGLVGNTGGISAFTYLELGTSATAVAVGQTALQAAITDTGLARAAATVSRVTTSVSNDTLQLTYTWTATGSKTIEEVGMFNASSSGIMLNRSLTGTKVLANTDIYTVTYKVQFT